MINIDQISVYDLLPPNAQADPTVSAAARALDSHVQQLNKEVEDLSFYRRLMQGRITDAEADERAWQDHVDFWDTTLPLEQKVQLLKNAKEFHRIKGTPGAIEDLITILFGEGKVEEWFQYGGEPGYFRVTTNNPEVTLDRAQEFYRAVESVKRLTAHMEEVILSQTESFNLYHGAGVHVSEYILIR
ncbi:phage tail protein I [Paenibacillus sp. F411]|uniref:phage tail protein I n=1 Tax=Paenibacillus sp. F411 TaxID=2820239 RepID=UPI001AB016B1|nr:phage tail protein I [Paenibacillus sp. F411]MBO2943591.1 phage tail protein I [Paenibacillus sp. F411]